MTEVYEATKFIAAVIVVAGLALAPLIAACSLWRAVNDSSGGLTAHKRQEHERKALPKWRKEGER